MGLLSPEGNGEDGYDSLLRGTSNRSPTPEAPGGQHDHLTSQPRDHKQSPPHPRCPGLLISPDTWPGLSLGTEEVSPSPREVTGCNRIQTWYLPSHRTPTTLGSSQSCFNLTSRNANRLELFGDLYKVKQISQLRTELRGPFSLRQQSLLRPAFLSTSTKSP